VAKQIIDQALNGTTTTFRVNTYAGLMEFDVTVIPAGISVSPGRVVSGTVVNACNPHAEWYPDVEVRRDGTLVIQHTCGEGSTHGVAVIPEQSGQASLYTAEGSRPTFIVNVAD
jgi:hypothetical protein